MSVKTFNTSFFFSHLSDEVRRGGGREKVMASGEDESKPRHGTQASRHAGRGRDAVPAKGNNWSKVAAWRAKDGRGNKRKMKPRHARAGRRLKYEETHARCIASDGKQQETRSQR